MEPEKTVIDCPGCFAKLTALRARDSRTPSYRCSCPYCGRSILVKGRVSCGPEEQDRKGSAPRRVFFRRKDEGGEKGATAEGVAGGDGGRAAGGRRAGAAMPRRPDTEPPLFDPEPRAAGAADGADDGDAADGTTAKSAAGEPGAPRVVEELEVVPAPSEGGPSGTKEGPREPPGAGRPRLDSILRERGRRESIVGGPRAGGPGSRRKRERAGEPREGKGARGRRLTLTTVAAYMLTATFVLGIFNAFFFTPSEADVDRPEDLFTSGRGTLAGKVMDKATGLALSDVSVALRGTEHSTHTNDDGFYYLYNVSDGDYTLEASLDGYGSVIRRVTYQSSYPHTEILELEEGDETVEQDRRSPLRERPARDPELTSYIMGVLSVPALLAAVLSLRRERFRLAVAFAFMGCFSLGFGFGSGLSFAAMVIIIYSREDFRRDGVDEGMVGGKAEGKVEGKVGESPEADGGEGRVKAG